MPPTGTNWPLATFCFTLAKTSGRCSLIHASCWACDMAKTNSGWSSIRCATFDEVRATLRTVSRSGHSHAESMWACPTALTRCAEALAGAASTPASASRARPALPATSARSRASRQRSTARSNSKRRASPVESCVIRLPTTSRSWTSSHTSCSKTASSIRVSRYSGSSLAVRRSPSRVGDWPTRIGLDAASTYHSTSSPPSTGAPTRTQALCGLSAFTASPSAR